MTPEEIEDRAMYNLPLPGNMSKADSWLYILLRALHTQHRLGQISRETAKSEKRTLLRQYEQMLFEQKYIEHTQAMWNRIAAAHIAYRNNPCIETADKFVEAVYNVKLKIREGQRHDDDTADS